MTLRVLKENEEGFGIIESITGHISPTYHRNLTEGNAPLDLTKPLIFYATLQKYGVENRNGRIYPEEILKREVERYREVIKRNASFHELDHPQESVISLKGGSPYRIIDMFWEGNVLIGKLELLVSDGYRRSGIISCHGDLLAMYLITYGMTVGVSSRGVGSLKKVDSKNIVQTDFELICFDAVSSPSTYGSYIYDQLSDFAKYDEKAPSETQQIAAPNNNDFMNKLSAFLGK